MDIKIIDSKEMKDCKSDIPKDFVLKIYEEDKDDFSIMADSIKRECKSESTSEKYIYIIKRFYIFCRKFDIDPNEPTVDDIKQFFDYYEHWAASTRILALAAIRRYYNKDRNMGLVININIKKVEKDPYVLSRERLEDYFNSIQNEYDRLILQLKYSSGIRSGELINLRWGDINFNTATGMVYDTKNGTDRVIYFLYKGKELLKNLKQYRGNSTDDDFIFPKLNNPHNLYDLCKKYAKQFGDQKMTPTTIRHCFGTHLAEIGKSNFQLKTLMGHKTIMSTEKYINMAKSSKLVKLVDEQPLNN